MSLRAQNSAKNSVRRGNPDKIKAHQFKPGQSGNPGGRPKRDFASEIARAVFEGNQQAIYDAMLSALLKGNAYVFKELAERAYGKLKETNEFTGADGGPIQASIVVRFVKPDGIRALTGVRL